MDYANRIGNIWKLLNVKMFSSSSSSSKHPDKITHSLSLIVSGFRGSCPGVMRPRSEVNNSPPSNSEVEN
jgi:hypothetical protein